MIVKKMQEYRNIFRSLVTNSNKSVNCKMLWLKNVEKYYGSYLALSIPNLTLAGGLIWVKGENGSGKTTLFKSLAGLLSFRGDVLLDNSLSLKNQPLAYRRYVNYGEAEPLYPGFLTPHDLVQFVGKAKDADPDQRIQLCGRFGVQGFADQPCGGCSSGMLKKLSLSLAFLGAPRAIILDEPFITLDHEARKNLAKIMKETLAGNTMILVSSHQSFKEHGIRIDETLLISNKTVHS
jgi:ABC-2 type transport system ATP-binding protein